MKKRPFGRHDFGPVEQVTLESGDAAVSILSLGCAVRDWRIDGARGSLSVVLGFPRLEDYVLHARAHGAVVGRVANRTANGRFELDGKTRQLSQNDGVHHLHGGAVGLDRRVWAMEVDTAAETVRLAYSSPDGEEGYPGRVEFAVSYRLDGARLICEMSGRPDRPTPINLAQHNYYNLAGTGTVRDHVLEVDAPEFTPVDAGLIPRGVIRSVEGTALDFTEPRSLEEADPEGAGIDNNLVLRAGRDPGEPAARVHCPRSGVSLRLRTSEPALQIYDGAGASVAVPGHEGQIYGPFAGLCLEAQHFPDSLHNPDWPSIIRTPEQPYLQRLEVEIARR